MRHLVVVCLSLLAFGCGGETAATTTGTSTSGSGGGSDGQGGSAPIDKSPDAQFLPASVNGCPAEMSGTVTLSPDGIAPRDVLVEQQGGGGPLIIFWHGAGGSPTEGKFVLGATFSELMAAGGVLVAPYHDPAAGQFPWFLTTGGSREDDMVVADEIVACAIEKLSIDPRRIHVVGFSAGALNTTQMSYRRSGYVASVVTYSGGLIGTAPEPQDASNPWPAMILHGGPSDQVIVNFEQLSNQYHADLTGRGSFAFICNHGSGHTVPQDAIPAAWQFFQDHPFGALSPYLGGLPLEFPAYCSP